MRMPMSQMTTKNAKNHASAITMSLRVCGTTSASSSAVSSSSSTLSWASRSASLTVVVGFTEPWRTSSGTAPVDIPIAIDVAGPPRALGLKRSMPSWTIASASMGQATTNGKAFARAGKLWICTTAMMNTSSTKRLSMAGSRAIQKSARDNVRLLYAQPAHRSFLEKVRNQRASETQDRDDAKHDDQRSRDPFATRPQGLREEVIPLREISQDKTKQQRGDRPAPDRHEHAHHAEEEHHYDIQPGIVRSECANGNQEDQKRH